MTETRDKNTTSLAGEFAVLSQLALKGMVANMTLGHTKGVDRKDIGPDLCGDYIAISFIFMYIIFKGAYNPEAYSFANDIEVIDKFFLLELFQDEYLLGCRE